MSTLRIKIAGGMRSMTGAEILCVIRSYLATAARRGSGRSLDVLTCAAGSPSRPDRNPAANSYSAHTQNYKRRQTYPVTLATLVIHHGAGVKRIQLALGTQRR